MINNPTKNMGKGWKQAVQRVSANIVSYQQSNGTNSLEAIFELFVQIENREVLPFSNSASRNLFYSYLSTHVSKDM